MAANVKAIHAVQREPRARDDALLEHSHEH
jgi:hypothetical protein